MRRILLLSLLAALAILPSQAGITIYTDQALFQSALASFSVEDFTGNVLHVAGLSFVSTVGSIGGTVGAASGADQFNDRPVNGGAFTTWTLPGPTNGFGANWDLTPGGAGQGLEFFIDGVTLVGTEVPNSYSGQFFGFISDTPFTSVKYDGGTQPGSAETHSMDNLTFGAVGAGVPEPGTFGLLASAGAALMLIRRRR